jgi:hypothetical protein
MSLDQKFALAIGSGIMTLGIGGYLYFQREVIRQQRATINLQSRAINIQRSAMQEMVNSVPIVMNMN